MTTTQAVPAALPSFDKVRMEERKRSLAVDADDLAPSRKRLVKDENGQAMRMDAEKEKDVEVRLHHSRAWSSRFPLLTRGRDYSCIRKTPSCAR